MQHAQLVEDEVREVSFVGMELEEVRESERSARVAATFWRSNWCNDSRTTDVSTKLNCRPSTVLISGTATEAAVRAKRTLAHH
jgi:hypothetical protein